MKIGYKELVAAAKKEIATLDVEEALKLIDNDEVVFVDLRDVRELQRDGKIPGSIHTPRGMIEFWVDPESPYHKPIFAQNKHFVFYCNKDWRSALATQTVQNMGLENVCQLTGGFTAWQLAELPIEEKSKK